MRQQMITGVFATLLLAAGSSAWAAGASVNLDSAFQFGDHVYGPDITMEDLKGRVVLIEDWGLK